MCNDGRRLLIIGVVPEKDGIGGVSIHVRRLLDCLELRGWACTFADYRCDSKLSILRAIARSRVVHLHVSNPLVQLLLVLCCRVMMKKTVLTLHGNYGRYGWLKNLMVRCSVRLASVPVAINRSSHDACLRVNGRTVMASAFIAPQRMEKLAPEIEALVADLHAKGRVVVSTNAFNVAYDKDGNDIYGIGFLVDFFKHQQKYALVVSDPSGNYHKKFMTRHENVSFIDFPHPYFELLRLVDCFVRNTSTDGDALSVREALSLGKPALCTDVVDRPAGATLFGYCDRRSFEAALRSAAVPEAAPADGADRILAIYEELLKC